MHRVTVTEAKQALDRLIAKQRVHMYKPIQVAEILYRVRSGELSIDQLEHDIEAYRNPSKRWRDNITRLLLDRVSTSSQKYQDNLFERNAIPPQVLAALARANINGIVERYIYKRFWERQRRVFELYDSLCGATPSKFNLETFLAEFEQDRRLRRSIGKVFEIVVYALFDTLVKHLRVMVTVSAQKADRGLLQEFDEFARLLMGIDSDTPAVSFPARLYRTGIANAADRGLDMWANFGPAVQVKHITLSEQLVQDVASEIVADKIVIVCKDGEREVIAQVCRQLGQRIQGIMVQSQLVEWYSKALRGEHSKQLGSDLLSNLRREFLNEFPFSKTFQEFYESRGYHKIHLPRSPFWIAE